MTNNFPTGDDIFNLLTYSYNIHNNKFDSDIFIKSFKNYFPIECGDYVECNRIIKNIGIIDFDERILVEYYQKKTEKKCSYEFGMNEIKNCKIGYVEEDNDDGWFNIGDNLKLNDDDCRDMIEKYGEE